MEQLTSTQIRFRSLFVILIVPFVALPFWVWDHYVRKLQRSGFIEYMANGLDLMKMAATQVKTGQFVDD